MMKKDIFDIIEHLEEKGYFFCKRTIGELNSLESASIKEIEDAIDLYLGPKND